MTSRILPREEWARLHETDLGDQDLSPETCVVVVEQDGQVIGCWAVVTCLHAEGLWIAPAHRAKGAVAKRLLRGVASVAAQAHVRAVCVGVIDPGVEGLAQRLGGERLEGLPYVLPVERFQ